MRASTDRVLRWQATALFLCLLLVSVPGLPCATHIVDAPVLSLRDRGVVGQANGDLWNRLRQRFGLPVVDDDRIRQQLEAYLQSATDLDRLQRRARRYLYFIANEAERLGVPGELALLPAVESAFEPFAYSPGQAAGLWQFTAATGRRFGLKQNWWYDARRDIEAATRAAFAYLCELHGHFGGDWFLALAGYNAGERRVQRARRRNREAGKSTGYWSLELPAETRAYVPRLLAFARIVATPARYGVRLEPIADEPYFAGIEAGAQIDLASIARLGNVQLQELYLLNPGFNRWVTDPDGPHRVLVPVRRLGSVRDGLASRTRNYRFEWRRHRIGFGETLGHIARRYRTTVSNLRAVNGLPSDLIRAGHHLLIPLASGQGGDDAADPGQPMRAGRQKSQPRLEERNAVRPLPAGGEVVRVPLERGGRQLVAVHDGGHAPLAAIDLPSLTRRTIRYRVRKGDSLDSISRRFRVTVNQLRQWNAGALKGKYIHPGQRLTLHVDVTRQTS